MTVRIAAEADIARLEAAGLAAFLPQTTPVGLLEASAAATPEAVALRLVRGRDAPAADEVVTYAAFLARIYRTARLFRRLGVGPDDSVALMVPNSPGGFVTLFAAQLAGRACPINPMLKPDHIAALIAAAGARAVVVLGENADVPLWSALVPALRAEGVELPVLDCEATRASPGSDGGVEALAAAESAAPLAAAGGAEALAAFYHTGGTTGAPKLVRHTRLNEAHVARSCALYYDLSPRDVMLNGFPLFHVAGAFVYGLSAFSAGAELLIPGLQGMRNAAFVGTIWQQVARYGITVIGGVPTVISALNGVEVDADLASLRLMLTGGSPLPTELADAFERRTGKPVRNILGMTESAGAMAVEPFHGPRTPGSCGLRLPFSHVAALDPESLAPLPQGAEGIVAVRGPNVSPGYSDPGRDAGTFENGWLVSGDLGRVDAEGRVFVTGRSKDIIIRGAHNLDPQMIEDAFLSHPSVASAAAVGMPDAYAGELPVVFIQLRQPVAVEAVEDHVRAAIHEPAALPKRIAIVETMPLTPIGKIFKPALRREATRWAIEAAAERVGVRAEIAVAEDLSVQVTVTDGAAQALRDALAGMALRIEIDTAPPTA